MHPTYQAMPFSQVTFYTVTDNEKTQRIDNFLLKHLKKVPKSHIYRIIRKGEVRVNKKRIKAKYKLQQDDIIRIPPIKLEESKSKAIIPQNLLDQINSAILLEDAHLIAINKPSGLSVHSGSDTKFGLIEIVRKLRKDHNYLELVHRLDKETSGVILIAKNRQILQELHSLLRNNHQIQKHYIALVYGEWIKGKQTVIHNLKRQANCTKKMQIGKEGKKSISIFRPLKTLQNSTLMEVQLITGRTHQIRAQLAYLKHPIIGDNIYGDQAVNSYFKKEYQYSRLFLHANHISFHLKSIDKTYLLKAYLPHELLELINRLKP